MIEMRVFFVAIIFVGALLFSESKANVVFYEDNDFTGYMIELPPKTECTNLPAYAYRRAKSMKTSDCVIVYNSLNCNNNGVSYKLVPGDYTKLSEVSHQGLYYQDNFQNAIYSFRKCSEAIGGSKTHITLYTRRGIEFEIENLCERVTIPSYAAYPTAFDNHGNCVVARGVFKSGITSVNLIQLEGGRSTFSLRTNANTHSAQFYSLEPCEPNPSCVVLNATVTGFEIIDPELEVKARVPIGAPKTYNNDGWATVSQEYTAQKVVTEATEINFVRSLTKINNWNVKAPLDYTFSTGDVLSPMAKQIKNDLVHLYTREDSKSAQTRKVVRREVLKEFMVKQNIEIQPCTKYKIESFIKMAETYPLKYKIMFEVNGLKGSSRLKSSEIQEILGVKNYIRDRDELTVVYSDEADIFLDFGVESHVDGKGEILKDCLNKKKEFDEEEDGKNWAGNGQNSGENGQTSGENGQTSGENGQTSGENGQTSEEHGQTSGESGKLSPQD